MKRLSGSSLVRIFAVPTAIAAVSLAGLILALIGNGGYDVVAWLAVAAPIVATAWALLARRRGS